jgi:hypothetical protein
MAPYQETGHSMLLELLLVVMLAIVRKGTLNYRAALLRWMEACLMTAHRQRVCLWIVLPSPCGTVLCLERNITKGLDWTWSVIRALA